MSKRKCYLSLNKKLKINSYKGNNLLKKRSELIKYRIKEQASKQTCYNDMIARTSSKVFHVKLNAMFPQTSLLDV